MIKFAEYLSEAKDSEISKNDSGKLHEVILGGLVNHYAKVYQKNKSNGHNIAHELAMKEINNPKKIKGGNLKNIHHMPQFLDNDNKSAEQLHNEISSTISPKTYDEHFKHALHGASHLIDNLHDNGIRDIKGVHFTANPKDIQRLTKKDEKGNNSDIVVEHGHKKIGGGFFGVSLKLGAESKLNNPGMGKFSKSIDSDYQSITGKKGTLDKDASANETAAKLAHGKILSNHKSFLEKHFGENGKTSPGKLSYNDEGHPVLHDDAFRYFEKGERSDSPKYKSMYSKMLPDEKKKFGSIYAQLRDSRTEIAKRATNSSFGKHLTGIMKTQTPENKEKIRGFLKKTFNIKKNPEDMPVVRLNTWNNSEAAVKKGASERSSNISDAENDFDKHFDSSYGNYKVKTNPGTIHTTLSGPSGHETNFVMDSSPAGGKGAVNRNGVHIWDKSKKSAPETTPSVPKITPTKNIISSPSKKKITPENDGTPSGEFAGVKFKSKSEIE